jgi:hypothetical protein
MTIPSMPRIDRIVKIPMIMLWARKMKVVVAVSLLPAVAKTMVIWLVERSTNYGGVREYSPGMNRDTVPVSVTSCIPCANPPREY